MTPPRRVPFRRHCPAPPREPATLRRSRPLLWNRAMPPRAPATLRPSCRATPLSPPTAAPHPFSTSSGSPTTPFMACRRSIPASPSPFGDCAAPLTTSTGGHSQLLFDLHGGSRLCLEIGGGRGAGVPPHASGRGAAAPSHAGGRGPAYPWRHGTKLRRPLVDRSFRSSTSCSHTWFMVLTFKRNRHKVACIIVRPQATNAHSEQR